MSRKISQKSVKLTNEIGINAYVHLIENEDKKFKNANFILPKDLVK